uniref:DUF4939 domain-containing protein n=1 Tax=Sinocyclocheilus anshuiensis TaxID=1608454 RepID=A0A671SJH4_9TELE
MRFQIFLSLWSVTSSWCIKKICKVANTKLRVNHAYLKRLVLEELVSALRTSLTPVTTPSSASVSPMALPASYAGDAAVCGGFLLQVDLFIEMQPQKFTTERSKVAFLISLLNGKALEWARAIGNANNAIINSYDAFKNLFKEAFAGSHSPSTAPAMGLCHRLAAWGQNSLRVKFTHCPSRSARPWRITSRRLLSKVSSDQPPPRQPRVSSLWARRTGA